MRCDRNARLAAIRAPDSPSQREPQPASLSRATPAEANIAAQRPLGPRAVQARPAAPADGSAPGAGRRCKRTKMTRNPFGRGVVAASTT